LASGNTLLLVLIKMVSLAGEYQMPNSFVGNSAEDNNQN